MVKSRRQLLSYLAGLFDGEGYIGINKGRRDNGGYPSYSIAVTVRITEELLARLFHFNFGGSIYYRKYENPNWSPIWSWTISGKNAEPFLQDILPYLLLKKPQAELALYFIRETRKGKKGYLLDTEKALREASYILMKGMNKRGGG